MLVFQTIAKMFQVLQEMPRSCMSYQGISSFDPRKEQEKLITEHDPKVI